MSHPTHRQCHADARVMLRSAQRRRGNIMLFVIFILAALFASTVAFMALTRKDARIVDSAADQRAVDFVIEGVADAVMDSVVRSLVTDAVRVRNPGGDGSFGTSDDFMEMVPGRIPYSAYAEDNDGPDGLPFTFDDDELPDNPDAMSVWAEIPGVHPLYASIEPYVYPDPNPGLRVLEWFAVSDLGRVLDNQPDVHNQPLPPFSGATATPPIQPTLPVTHPLRIRKLDEYAGGGEATWPFGDPWIEDYEREGFRRDADGDGVVDSRLVRIGVLGGEPDWVPLGTLAGEIDVSDTPMGRSLGDDNGPNALQCDGEIDASPNQFTGQPSFTGGQRSPLPCDDQNNDNILNFGEAFPQFMRRGPASDMRDPDTDPQLADLESGMYLALRVIQNGGMISLNDSHYTLVDNVLGLNTSNAQAQQPVAVGMFALPYPPESTEPLLRRRGFLPFFDLPSPSLAFGADIAESFEQSQSPLGSQASALYDMLFAHMNTGAGQRQWFGIEDEPGGSGIFDTHWVDWMNPNLWNDPAGSAGSGANAYDVRHLLTSQSTDDLLMRNGLYDPDGPDGPLGKSPPVLLTDFFSPIGTLMGPVLDIQDEEFDWWDSPLVYDPRDEDIRYGSNGQWPYQPDATHPDTALEMYPGYDPHFVATGIGDPSFVFVNPGVLPDDPADDIRRPNVPAMLESLPPTGLALPTTPTIYRVPRNADGSAKDPRMGRMQLALHSIGDINNPTQREIQTVQDYFTVMLRNVSAQGWSDDDIHDQAAQLTANFIDFADFDNMDNHGPVFDPDVPSTYVPGGKFDIPTRVVSRAMTNDVNNVYYGFENQPFITETFYYKPTNGNVEYAIELFNPSTVGLDNLGPDAASPGDGAGLGYYFRIFEDGAWLGNNPLSDPNDVSTIEDGLIPIPPAANLGAGQFESFKSPGAAVGNFIINGVPPTNLWPQPAEDATMVQLIRRVEYMVDGVLTFRNIVLDEMQLLNAFSDTGGGDIQGPGGPGQGAAWASLQRDTTTAGGWIAMVPVGGEPPLIGNTFGEHNDWDDMSDFAPVHATTDSNGLESAYPTTGSMLLLMRWANTDAAFPLIATMTARLQDRSTRIDNGHMPVFDPHFLASARERELAQHAWLGKQSDTGRLGAQPLDGTTLLSIPWGQLVFDYFTALPLANRYDPMAAPITTARIDDLSPEDPADQNNGIDDDGDGVVDDLRFVDYLRANQPTVEWGGLRVHGRININAAPWKVLQGLPLMPWTVLPIYKNDPSYRLNEGDGTSAQNMFSNAPGGFELADDDPRWNDLRDPDGGGGSDAPIMSEPALTILGPGVLDPFDQLGEEKAQGIVAYRELRQIRDLVNNPPQWTTGNYNMLAAGGWRLRADTSHENSNDSNFLAKYTQRHTAGFLTVGELANVSNLNASSGSFQMDNGMEHGGFANMNYLFAVAPLVALGDWVTVKGHTFTAYGVVRGHGMKDEVDKKAVRFEMTFDRSNILATDDPDIRPTVIYSKQGPYLEISKN